MRRREIKAAAGSEVGCVFQALEGNLSGQADEKPAGGVDQVNTS